jgi:hypothetical protein
MRQVRLSVEKSRQQAAAFEKIYEGKINPQRLQILSDFRDATIWRRKSFLFRYRHDLWPDYWLHAVALLWFL